MSAAVAADAVNLDELLAWKRAEVRRARDRVEDFERSLRGRKLTGTETAAASLSLRSRWSAKRYAEKKLEEFLTWLDADRMHSEPGT